MKKIITLIVFVLTIASTAIAGVAQDFTLYQYLGNDTILESSTTSKLWLKKSMLVYLQGKIELKQDSMEFVSIDKASGISYQIKKNDLVKCFRQSKVKDTLRVINVNSLAELVATNASETTPSISLFQSSDSVFAIRNNGKASIALYINGEFDSPIASYETRLIGMQTLGNSENELFFCGENFVPFSLKFTLPIKAEDSSCGFTKYLILLFILFIIGFLVCIYKKLRDKKNNEDNSQKEYSFYVSSDKTFNKCFESLAINPKKGKKRKQGRGKISKIEPLEYVVQKIKLLENYNKEDIKNIILTYYGNLQTNGKIYDYVCEKLEKRIFEFGLPVECRVGYTKEMGFEYLQKQKLSVKRIKISEMPPMNTDDADVWSQISNDLGHLREILNLPAKYYETSVVEDAKTIGETAENLIGEKVALATPKLVDNDNRSIEEDAVKFIANLERHICSLHNSIEKNCSHSDMEKKDLIKKQESLQADLGYMTKEKQKLEEKNVRIGKELKQMSLEKEQFFAKSKQLQEIVEGKELDITRLKTESREYNELLVFHKSCVTTAKTALEIVNLARLAQNLAGELYQSYKDSGQDMDAFCYYMERVSQKFKNGIKHLDNKVEKFNMELQLLAKTGLSIKNGWIDGLISNKKGETETNEAFVMKLYSDYMASFIGSALTMTDEYAYLIPSMIADVEETKLEKFVILSDNIRKAAKTLGYHICYARIMTPISQYSNVENVDYVDAGDKFAKDTIMEVKEMAVNYGSNKLMTKVSVQK